MSSDTASLWLELVSLLEPAPPVKVASSLRYLYAEHDALGLWDALLLADQIFGPGQS